MSQKYELNLLVDYLCFTIKLDNLTIENTSKLCLRDWLEIVLHLGCGSVDYVGKKAFYGYEESWNKNGITYCFGGRDDVFVQFSGSGCRFWETINLEYTWQQYIAELRSNFKSLHFSRLDIACDSFGLLDIKKMQIATIKQQYISRWKIYLVSQGNRENSIMFGSPTSDFRLRIYDKSLERIESGVDSETVPINWVRCEFQMRNDAGKSFIDSWLKLGDIGKTYCGIMRNQLRFWTNYDGKNADRMVLKPWWKTFLGDAEQIKMAYQGGLDYNLESLEKYVYNQAGSSIRTLIELQGGDITRLIGNVSVRPLNERQKELLSKSDYIDLADKYSFR